MTTREMEHLMQIAVILAVALMGFLASRETARRTGDRCSRHREEIDRLKWLVAIQTETVAAIEHQLENLDSTTDPEDWDAWEWPDDTPPF